MLDLKGNRYGCWEVIRKLFSGRCISGVPYTRWEVRCTKCGYVFGYPTRCITKRKEYVDCKNCKPKKKANGKAYSYGRNVNGFLDKSVKIYE